MEERTYDIINASMCDALGVLEEYRGIPEVDVAYQDLDKAIDMLCDWYKQNKKEKENV